MSPYVLVAEDDRDIQELILYNLQQEGFDTSSLNRGDQVIPEIAKRLPDILLLDLMLPGLNGVEVCKLIRQKTETRSLPIIMVTARSTETDKIVGLELGADDYLTKPFSPKELIARIKAVLRRSQQVAPAASALKRYDIEIDLNGHRVFAASKELSLTLTEFNILKELASNPGQVLSRNALMEKAIGNDVTVTDRTIDVHVAALRKKLGESGDLIETVRGVGYRFKE